MSAAVQRVLDALEARDCRVARSGAGWQCQCPAHEDRKPSLSIGEGDDGRALIRCQANCATVDVLAALGLAEKDLFERRNGSARVKVATYPYVDEQGEILFEVVRYEPKDFRQRRPDGEGGLIWKLGDTRRVIYRLPRVIAAAAAGERVYIAEGEKDVAAIEKAGATATCNPGGAGKWKREYASYLRGAQVIVVADRDTEGRKHARAVAASLGGMAASVALVEAAAGKDASDHLAAGRGLDELVPLAAEPEAAGKPGDIGAKPAGPESGTGKLAPGRRRKLTLTDAGNAQRYAADHGANVRHVDARGWFIWTGTRWKLNTKGAAMVRAKQTATSIYLEAESEFAHTELSSKGEPVNMTAKWAAKSEDRRRLEAMLALGASEPGIPATSDELDADPLLINCANGTIDLRTGESREHRREDLLTKQCAAAYRPDARAPVWQAFLARVQPDAAVRGYLKRLFGSALSGERRDHVLSVHFGEGANGKTTFLDAVRDAVGDYAMEAATGLLVAKPHGLSAGDESAIAQLAGRRLVTTSELAAGAALDEPLVKRLTGDKRMRAKLMRQDHFEFTLTAMMVLVTNHRPRVTGTDLGMWRRIQLTPWTVTIAPGEQDPDLPRKLKAERDGILAWLVEGFADHRKRGLCPPEAVQAASAAYRRAEDPLSEWISDQCELRTGAWCSAQELRGSYAAWNEREHQHPLGKQKFADALRSRGCAEARTNTTRGWAGIRLLDAGDGAGVTFRDSHHPYRPTRARAHVRANMEETSRNVTDAESAANPAIPARQPMTQRDEDGCKSGAEHSDDAAPNTQLALSGRTDGAMREPSDEQIERLRRRLEDES